MADDIVMESTTDSPEQIAEGLGLELSADAPVETSEPESVEADIADPAEDAEPVEEVTPIVAKAVADRRPARVQRKSADAAAAAARREADAQAAVLKVENDALRRRIEELASGRLGAVAEPQAARAAVVEPILPESIPDSHPDMAKAVARLTAIGAKPKQEDFEDFQAFEDKRDQWIEDRAHARARVDTVREDVARRETITQTDANRAALATKTAFAQSEAAARARHVDYDEKMADARAADLRINDAAGIAVMESPIGAEVVYHLVTHPADVARLNALTPHRAIVEIGMIEARLALATGKQATAAPQATNRGGIRFTKAPDPQSTMLGDGPTTARKRDLNDPTLTLPEYNRLRDEMDRESGRRTH